MTSARPAVTLAEVAARAGVSLATASRALSGKPRVSPATIDRVRAAAGELGYHVNPAAKSLRAGTSGLVGMVVPVIGIPFFAQLVDAIEEELAAAGYELLLADSHGVVAQEAKRLAVLDARRVDGVLVIASDRVLSAATMRRTSSAVVTVDRALDDPVADFVGVDNEVGMRLVLDHLHERGVRTIAYAGSDDASSNGVERWAACRSECERLGVRIVEAVRGDFSIATGRRAAERFVQRGLPDAIVTASDSIAAGLLSGLHALGVDVPGDVLLTGFDGSELADVVWPTLTTVVQPIDSIATEAVDSLVQRIRGRSGPVRRRRLEPALRIAGSTDGRRA